MGNKATTMIRYAVLFLVILFFESTVAEESAHRRFLNDPFPPNWNDLNDVPRPPSWPDSVEPPRPPSPIEVLPPRPPALPPSANPPPRPPSYIDVGKPQPPGTGPNYVHHPSWIGAPVPDDIHPPSDPRGPVV